MKKRSIAFGTTPSLLILVLFYTLAIHMYFSLGGWPESIGTRGFPETLKIHSSIATTFFYILFMITLFISPIIIFICGFIEKWRKYIPFWLANAVAFGVSCLVIQSAPSGFLYWWWD
jgi:magnesium-transporting ATPase (P-type)